MLMSCYQNASLAAAPAYFAPLTAVNRGPNVVSKAPAPPGACGCFAAAQSCLLNFYCAVPPSSLSAVPQQSSLAALKSLCAATTCGATSGVCASITDVAPAPPTAPGQVNIYAAPLGNIGKPSQQPFDATASSAHWMA